MERFHSLERIVWRAPLGLRFTDLARLTPVTDGLEVTARPFLPAGARTTPVLVAEQSPLSGIYGFRSLPRVDLTRPSFRAYEWGDDPNGFLPTSDWCSEVEDEEPSGQDLSTIQQVKELLDADEPAHPDVNFVVSVTDRLGRFLPQTLLLCLPKEQLVEVPLFSAPARPGITGMAAIRGELRLPLGPGETTERPAAWAMVFASLSGGPRAFGMTDHRGMFTLYLPYAGTVSATCPEEGARPRWRVTIRVEWDPNEWRLPPDADPSRPPDTRSLLTQGSLGSVPVMDTPEVSAQSVVRCLSMGQNLVVRTEGLNWLTVVA